MIVAESIRPKKLLLISVLTTLIILRIFVLRLEEISEKNIWQEIFVEIDSVEFDLHLQFLSKILVSIDC